MEPITPKYPQNESNNFSQTKSYAKATSNTCFPTKDQAVIMESLEGVTLKEYILSLSTLIKPSTIRFISRISNSRVCMYLDSKKTADEILNQEIKLKGKLIKILPYITRNKRIVLSNVCPVIPHSVIEEKLLEMKVTLMSPLSFMKVGISEPGFSHILSFRRQLYVSPEDVKLLPESFQVHYEDTTYWIYVSTDALKCFVCNTMGHLAKNCPQNSIVIAQEVETSRSQLNEIITDCFTQNMEFQTPDSQPRLTLRDKGVKRLHSITTSGSDITLSENILPIVSTAKNPKLLEEETSCDSISAIESSDEDIVGKPIRLKKKIKSEDTREDKQVWTDIKNEFENQGIFPINMDAFISLLDSIKGKRNVKDIVADYSDNIKELIFMCNSLHPKMNRSLKNRCSRLTKKLHEILNYENIQDRNCPSDN